MARGWESKAVEAQQADHEQDAGEPVSLTPAEVADHARRHTRALARARVEAELGRVLNPAHRAMLEAALRELVRCP